jgi:2-oxoglutarate ferredoxin oxidoreductase subunit alpha
VYGRNGDCPLAVIAACTPGDCFDMAIEAVRIATKYMTPVILLTDGFLANGAEPWKIPDIGRSSAVPGHLRTRPEGFHPFQRDPETLARTWAIPGTPGLEHRIGGLEKHHDSGNISYDPDNHHKMTKVRAAKIAGIADDIPRRRSRQGETPASSWSSAGARPTARSPRPCSAPAARASRSRTCTSAT